METARLTASLRWHVATRGAGLSLLSKAEALCGPLETWDAEALERLAFAAPKAAAALSDPALDGRARSILEAAAKLGFVVDPWTAWPRLRALPDPPVVLFRKGGKASDGPALTVVGARAATAHGLRATRALAGAAAAAGVAIVSGLARGIDAAAHRAALESGGLTIAVLGNGPGRAYPPENAALQEEIGDEGTLLTEHPPGVPPKAAHFPRRNRLLAALCDAALLVEARVRSGSLTTIRWAADLGKDVLVVPGPFDAPLSEAPIVLLREGATAVAAPEHVFEALGLEASATSAESRAARGASEGPAPTTAAEGRLLALARGEPTDVDDLVRLSGEPPSTVLAAVLSLETRGLLRRRDDGRTFEVP
jgi:DNA processing protein